MAKHRRTGSQNYDHLIKLILIGDEGTGKSSLMSRFCDQQFSHSYVATIGVDFKIRTIEVNVDGLPPQRIKMQMWDTAGQERFNSITKSFYRGAHVLVVVYDVTNRESFLHSTKWLSGCVDVTGHQIPKCLIGNKSDLSRIRQVEREEGESFAEKHGMVFAETSAKEDSNVSSIFEEMAKEFVKSVRENINAASTSSNGKIILVDEAEEKSHERTCWSLLFRKISDFFSSKRDSMRDGSSKAKNSIKCVNTNVVDRRKDRERVVLGS